ncbi:hypothetical protein ACFFGV_15315 [Pontibacillus salicampi]|uniref:Lipoprotein n=1 Tax=Pontibacillus salicampi TaxID=1449801 RepID=A0ABV6LRB1_9BACI
MKRKPIIVMLFALPLVLAAGCSQAEGEQDSTKTKEETQPISTDDSHEKEEAEFNSTEADKSSKEQNQDHENSGVPLDMEELDNYSSNQIEYARVWLQLGANQEIDELNVRHIPKGKKVNPDDETSESYPEDVIQLSGSRLVDGSVTYSGNGDGTINVYNVPLRWDGKYPAGEDFYHDIITQTKQVYIDTGDEQKVIRLIEMQKVH